MFDEIKKEIKLVSDLKRAKANAWFFKTEKGQYGYGDMFLGITVPNCRKIAVKFKDLPFEELDRLLKSKYHEERLIALLILVHNFEIGDDTAKNAIYDYYLKNTKYINNWDLVDLSAPHIVGRYLLNKERKILQMLAVSQNMWERRIAILSTFAFIVDQKDYRDVFTIADILIMDREDLLRKAVGWMLREVGKRVSEEKLEEYLKPRYKKMPRTTLRYAIERFGENKRKMYLKSEV